VGVRGETGETTTPKEHEENVLKKGEKGGDQTYNHRRGGHDKPCLGKGGDDRSVDTKKNFFSRSGEKRGLCLLPISLRKMQIES